ncbi:MAG: hypothetical protein R3E50_12495 [Halioglobus sp.]
MRTSTALVALLFASLSLASAAGTPATALDLQKVKKGILPSGGFYTVYQVTCVDQSTTGVISTDRQRRWCTGYGGQLSCYRRAQDAAQMACTGVSVADSSSATTGTVR